RGGGGGDRGARAPRRAPRRDRIAEQPPVAPRVLRDRAGRGVVEPVALRRRALRLPRERVRRPARHVPQDAGAGIRRRGEAPHPHRDLRALARLLRRLLPEGAEGAAPHRARLRRGVPRLRRDRRADDARRRLRDRRQGVRPGADVPLRHLHRPREPRGTSGAVDPVRGGRSRAARRPAPGRRLLLGGAPARDRAPLPAGERLAPARPRGGPMSAWEIVVGLETHAQLATRSKMFSGASTAFGAPPNTQASAVDVALPGVLPVANKRAVECAIRFGLAVGGRDVINRRSIFARKNYFYPDLPKGYQISQYELPVVKGGEIPIVSPTRGPLKIRLTRAHLEEDAGKLLHE